MKILNGYRMNTEICEGGNTNTLDINDDIRVLLMKIKAIIEDETLPEDAGVSADALKIERIRQMLKKFSNNHDQEVM